MKKSIVWTGAPLNTLSRRETDSHQHDSLGQIFCIQSGVMTLKTPRGSWIVPPGRVAWIGPGIRHSASSIAAIEGWSIYCPFKKDHFPKADVCVLRTSSLLENLLERVAHLRTISTKEPLGKSLMALALHELSQAEEEPLGLPMPFHPHLRQTAEAILDRGPGTRTVLQWAKKAGMSERSFSRHFRSETGMTFSHWRTLATHQKAIQMMSLGETVTNTALKLGYESVSAFISSFRQEYGLSPLQFVRQTSLSSSSNSSKSKSTRSAAGALRV
jgi:AraC-like DNA-binding protein